jgi:hypothetical protein
MSCTENQLVLLICVHASDVAATHSCVQHTTTVSRPDRSASRTYRDHRSQLRKHTIGAAHAASLKQSATADVRAIAT